MRILFVLLTIILFFSCRQQNTNNDTHDHDHEAVKLLITAYNEKFEVFAEADPFVVGKTSEILTHITLLEDFKPMRNGKVTLSLIVGSSGIRQTLDKPEKPGIYRFLLQPQSVGSTQVVFEIEYGNAIFRLPAQRFMVFDNEHDAIHAAEDLITEHPAAVAFTKEQSWLVSFATTPVERKAIGEVIKTVGKILPARSDEITLSAQSRGIVKFVNNSLYEGTALLKGEVLLEISGGGLAEGSTTQLYREARNNFERAKADYERISRLYEANITSEREFLQARNDYENAKAVFNNLSENFTERGQLIRSPVNGNLLQLLVGNGQYVEAGEPVAKLVRNAEIVIMTEIQQRYSHLLPLISTANLVGPNGNLFTLEQLNGKILTRAQNIHAQSNLLPLYLSVETNPGWFTGTLVDVYLKTTDPSLSMVVPNNALIEEQGYYFVFVQIHPESFEKREVSIGKTDGFYTQILQGLNEGERIVSKGAVLVKMAAASSNIDPHSGHVH